MSAPWIAAFIGLWATVVLLGLIVLGTLRRLAPLIERAEASLAAANERAAPGALATGARVPPFTAENVDGATFTEVDLREARTVVLFLRASCSACEQYVADLGSGQAPDLGAQLVVISESVEAGRRLARSANVTVLVDVDRSLAGAFESRIVPHVFIVEDGTVLGSGRPNTWSGLRQLLSDADEGGGSEADIVEAVPSRS